MNSYCAGIFRLECGVLLLTICQECANRIFGDMYNHCISRFDDRTIALRNYTKLVSQVCKWSEDLMHSEITAAASVHPLFQHTLSRVYDEYVRQLKLSDTIHTVSLSLFYERFLQAVSSSQSIQNGIYFLDSTTSFEKKDVIMDAIRSALLQVHNSSPDPTETCVIYPSDSASNVGCR